MEGVFGSRCESLKQWGLDDASARTQSQTASAERATREDSGAVRSKEVPPRPAARGGVSPAEPPTEPEEFAFSPVRTAFAAPDAPTGLHIAAATLADVLAGGGGAPLPGVQLLEQHSGQGAEAGDCSGGSQASSQARLALHSADGPAGVQGLRSPAWPVTTTNGLLGVLSQLLGFILHSTSKP